jgi:hypothetical protein
MGGSVERRYASLLYEDTASSDESTADGRSVSGGRRQMRVHGADWCVWCDKKKCSDIGSGLIGHESK